MSQKCVDCAFYWSPKEAAAVLDYLDRLRDCVWEMYHEDIVNLRYREELSLFPHPEHQQQLDLEESERSPQVQHSEPVDPDADIPF